jgi:hypothetical protein
MPAKKVGPKTQAVIDRTARMPKIPPELIDQFVDGQMTGESIEVASAAFKRALIERVLGGELSHHLGYLPGQETKQRTPVFKNQNASGLKNRWHFHISQSNSPKTQAKTNQTPTHPAANAALKITQ